MPRPPTSGSRVRANDRRVGPPPGGAPTDFEGPPRSPRTRQAERRSRQARSRSQKQRRAVSLLCAADARVLLEVLPRPVCSSALGARKRSPARAAAASSRSTTGCRGCSTTGCRGSPTSAARSRHGLPRPRRRVVPGRRRHRSRPSLGGRSDVVGERALVRRPPRPLRRAGHAGARSRRCALLGRPAHGPARRRLRRDRHPRRPGDRSRTR